VKTAVHSGPLPEWRIAADTTASSSTRCIESDYQLQVKCNDTWQTDCKALSCIVESGYYWDEFFIPEMTNWRLP
jgi:hypothetical protein